MTANSKHDPSAAPLRTDPAHAVAPTEREPARAGCR